MDGNRELRAALLPSRLADEGFAPCRVPTSYYRCIAGLARRGHRSANRTHQWLERQVVDGDRVAQGVHGAVRPRTHEFWVRAEVQTAGAGSRPPRGTRGVMAGDQSNILIGTSGWSYRSWRGPFFPNDLPARSHLEYYAERF